MKHWVTECLTAPTEWEGLLRMGEPNPSWTAFEDQYVALRKREGRHYSVTEVRQLPQVPRHQRHYAEWQIRARSAEKLVNHLQQRKGPWRLLDIGCGNGWMSAKMAQSSKEGQVLGLDVGAVELWQAEEAFGGNENLAFVQGDVFSAQLCEGAFDFVVLAGAIQYFDDVQALLRRLYALLRVGGEIHVVDSPFYSQNEIQSAAERTREYYASMGFPALAAHYHAHSWDALAQFSPTFLYQPQDWFTRILRIFPWNHESPFPWIVFRK